MHKNVNHASRKTVLAVKHINLAGLGDESLDGIDSA